MAVWDFIHTDIDDHATPWIRWDHIWVKNKRYVFITTEHNNPLKPWRNIIGDMSQIALHIHKKFGK